MENGDVEITTSLTQEMYTMGLTANAGEIEIGEREYDSNGHVVSGGAGSNILNVFVQYGDINVEFSR